jgi:hypothetical protein
MLVFKVPQQTWLWLAAHRLRTNGQSIGSALNRLLQNRRIVLIRPRFTPQIILKTGGFPTRAPNMYTHCCERNCTLCIPEF